MLARERLDLRKHLGGASARQLGVEQPLVGHQSELFEALRFRERPILVGELGIRVASP